MEPWETFALLGERNKRRRDQAKNPTWNTLKPVPMKKTSMSNMVFSDTAVKRSAIEREDLEPHEKSEKRPILEVTYKAIILLTTKRKLTFLSINPLYRVFRNILDWFRKGDANVILLWEILKRTRTRHFLRCLKIYVASRTKNKSFWRCGRTWRRWVKSWKMWKKI